MLQFTIIPPSPFFSQVTFPANADLLNKKITLMYNGINENNKLEFRAQVTYLLTDESRSQVFEVVKSESRYEIIKSMERKIAVEELMEVSQMAIQNLRDFLSHLTNINSHLLQIDPISLERDRHLLAQAADVLNR